MYKCLEEHPQVFTATPKEVHFFNRNFEKGESWYLDHFRPDSVHLAWGELTPDYIAHHETPQRAFALCPRARLVVILREPIERAYSIYRLKMGSTMNYPTFEEAFAHHPEILEHGLYAQHIERWRTFFDKEQLLIMTYNELVESEATTISRVYKHIGVDDAYVPTWIGKPYNAAMMPKLRSKLRACGLDPLIMRIGRTPVGDVVRKRIRARKLNTDPLAAISKATVDQLNEYYREPNAKLRELLGQELPGWS